MKVPFFLAEHGYKPDPENPLRFVNPDGHPWHPVTFKDELQKNHGQCIRGMLEAMQLATIARMEKLMPGLLDLKKSHADHADRHGDEQCDGCRWMKLILEERKTSPGSETSKLHCLMHSERIENCPQQEIAHARR